ncbi:hypothetical protein [Winogradskyella schleiferi]|nr:hypothetical protein [Winogradskyella schleiferi]
MSKSKSMTTKAASRIQRATAKKSSTGGVSEKSFASRAQRSAAKKK